MRVGRTERHLDIHAAVVLALLVGVRARDAGNRNRVAVDAERPWLPAQRESRAAAFAGGARGPVNSPYIHDAISEDTGTPSKRFTAVAPCAPVDALDRGRPRVHVHPERRAAPRLDGMLRHGKSLPCLRHGTRADRSPDNSIVTDCPTHVAQKASSMRGLSLSRAAVPVSGLGHTVSHANWRSVTSLGNCQKKFAQHREALHHSKPVTEARGTLYPIAV